MSNNQGIRYTEDEIKALGSQITYTGGHKRIESYQLRRALSMGYDAYLAYTEKNIAERIVSLQEQGKTITPSVWLDDLLPLLLHPESKKSDMERVIESLWAGSLWAGQQEETRQKYASGIFTSDVALQGTQAAELVEMGVLKPISSQNLLEKTLSIGLPNSYYQVIDTKLQGEFFVPKVIDALEADFLNKYKNISIGMGADENYRFAQSWMGTILGHSPSIEASGQKEQLLTTFLSAISEVERQNNGVIPFATWRLIRPLYLDTFTDPKGAYADILLDRSSTHPIMDFVTKSGDVTLSVLAARAKHEGTLLAEHPDDIKLLDTTMERVRQLFVERQLWQSTPKYYNHHTGTEPLDTPFYGLSYREDLYPDLTLEAAGWEGLPWSKPAIDHLLKNPPTQNLKHARSGLNPVEDLISMQVELGNPELGWHLLREQKHSMYEPKMLSVIEKTPDNLLANPENRQIISETVNAMLDYLNREIDSIKRSTTSWQKEFDAKQRRYGKQYYDPADRPVINQTYIDKAIESKAYDHQVEASAAKWLRALSFADFKNHPDLPSDPDSAVDLIMRHLRQPEHKIQEMIVQVQMAQDDLDNEGLSQEQVVEPIEKEAVKELPKQDRVEQPQQSFAF